MTRLLFTRFGGFIVAAMISFAAAAEEGAARVIKQYQDRVFQIRVIDLVAEKKSGLGSGFLVSADGLIATNYHVIANYVGKPDKFRIEYQDVAGKRAALNLVDIDVINDLALLKADALALEPLVFPDTPPLQGATIYSLGNPFDIGFTVVPGTYNGIDQNSYYRRIHFSGSVNPGMSGGPVLNAEGQVVGVNVSTAGDQISFLVPAKPLQQLLEHAQNRQTPLTQFDERIRQQLQANQRQMVDDFLAQEWPIQALGEGKALGEVKPFVKCWGNSSDDKELFVSVTTACRSDESIYLNDRFNSGVISYQFFWLEAGRLSNARFLSYYQQLFPRFEPDNRATEVDVGNYQCDEAFIQDAQGAKDKWVMCVRAYKKYPGLYDALYLRGSVDWEDRAFVSHFTLAGVDQKSIEDFMQRFTAEVGR